MKHLIGRIPKIFRNFYFIAGTFFLVWLVFFDSNDVLTQITLSKKKSELETSKAYYEDKIKEVEEDREALLKNEELLEKIAREKYLLKKDDEDVFVVVEEDPE